MAAQTKLLARHLAAESATHELIYTCPADKTAIVKEVCFTNLSGTATSLMVVDHGEGSGWVAWANVPATQQATDRGRFAVLEPGDTLYSFSTGEHTDAQWFEVFGAEVDAVA